MPKILSKKELRLLLKVPTTVRQAKQIIRRNKLALKALLANEEKTFAVGCPHCKGSCDSCAYPEGNRLFGDQCLSYMFGGVNYYLVCNFISLSPEAIKVHSSPESSGMDRRIKQDLAIRWLQGHIEWAEAVIKAKGTK